MESLKVPIILLLLLLGAFALMQGPLKPNPTKTPTGKPATTAAPDLEASLRNAQKALDKNNFVETLKQLEPFKGSDDVRVLNLLGFANAGIKDLDASAQAFEKSLWKVKDPVIGYSLAYVYETRCDLQQARALYQELIAAGLPKPMLIRGWLAVGRISLLMADPKTAMPAFDMVLELDPTVEEAYVGRIKAMRGLGQVTNLKAIRDKGDLMCGKNFSYHYWLGTLYFETGNYAKAQESFERCITLDKNNSSPHYYIYRIYRKTKKIEEAMAQLEKFYNLNQFLPYIFFQAALDAKTENRLDLTFKFLRTAIALDRSLLSRDDQGAIYAVEQHLKANGRPEEKAFWKGFSLFINSEFRKAYNFLLGILPKMTDPKLKQDAKRLVWQCEDMLAGERKYSEYQANLQREQQQAMSNLRRTMQQARTTTPGSEKEPETDRLKRVALSNPNDARLQYSTALQLARLGDFQGAKTFLGETIRLDQRSPEPYYSLAKLAQHEGNLAEAESHLKEALKSSPSHTQALSLLASLHLAAGDLERALQEAQSAVRANPNNGEGRLVLAQIQMQQQRPEQAMEELKYGLAVELDPGRRSQMESMLRQLQSR